MASEAADDVNMNVLIPKAEVAVKMDGFGKCPGKGAAAESKFVHREKETYSFTKGESLC